MAYCRTAHAQGATYNEIAGFLGCTRQTLHAWRCGACDAPRLLGRPCKDLAEDQREQALECLKAHWPHFSRARLREAFPDAPVRALDDIHSRYDHLRRRRETVLVYCLTWTRAGAVWAMDYTHPPVAVDGMYKKLLDVRDLASGKTLESLPVEEEAAFHTKQLLLRLFLQHGPPLVIKSDGGSPLVAEEVRQLLDEWGVAFLVSPPYWPKYNGACEAGHGSIKTRAHHIAAAQGRVGDWTCDDVEAARLQANELVRNRKQNGQSPDQLWNQREPISKKERKAFQNCLQKKREEASIEIRATLSDNESEAKQNPRLDEAERNAVRRTLETSGLLIERRRRIPLRIKR